MISISIAAIGVLSNWYMRTMQQQLIASNMETTMLVELSANIERRLYQSIVYLNAIKETEELVEGALTMDAPNQEMLINRFYEEMALVRQNIAAIQVQMLENKSTKDAIADIQRVDERFNFYSKLTFDWVDHFKEDDEESKLVFNTSISPYFRNRIIPVVTHLRENTVARQARENITLTEEMKQANFLLIWVTALFILFSMGIAFYLYRSIANPLIQLNKGAHALGFGWLEKPIEVTNRDEIGQLAASFNDMAEKLKKRTLARDYLDNIIESIHEALIVTDEDGIIVGLNKSTEQMLGYEREEMIGAPLSLIYDASNDYREVLNRNAEEEVIEFILQAKSGALIPVLYSESELKNPKGSHVGNVVVATDITQRKKANERIRESLREKEILLAEIHHRVKNNLAVISGILQLQSYSSQNELVIKALKESQSRIRSISLVHEKLYKSETMASIRYDYYVNDLLAEIKNMDMTDGINFEVILHADPIHLELNVAVPCSLLLNELVVSSFKKIVDKEGNGIIEVSLHDLGEDVRIAIQHNGVQSEDELDSLEHTLIDTLSKQIRGEINTTYMNQWVKTEIRFPKISDINI